MIELVFLDQNDQVMLEGFQSLLMLQIDLFVTVWLWAFLDLLEMKSQPHEGNAKHFILQIKWRDITHAVPFIFGRSSCFIAPLHVVCTQLFFV